MWSASEATYVVKRLLRVMQSSDLNADVILNGGLLAAMLVAIWKNNPAYDASGVLKMLCAKRQTDPTFRLAVIDGQTNTHTHTHAHTHTHTHRQTDKQTPSEKCSPFYPCWTQD